VPRISTRTKPRIPAIPGKSSRTKLAEAYEKLGITEIEANAAPKITPILRELPGKIDKAIEYLRGSHEPDAQKWLRAYDSLAVSVRKSLPFEAFCVASGITTKRMLEVITGACFEQSDAVSALLSKAAKPVIIQKSIKEAKTKKGWEDRKMILQHEGYAPVPKTQILNVQGDMNTDNRQQQSISIGSLTQIDSVMGRITDRFNERLNDRLLGSGDNHADTETKLLESSAEIPTPLLADNDSVDSNNHHDTNKLPSGAPGDSAGLDNGLDDQGWDIDL